MTPILEESEITSPEIFANRHDHDLAPSHVKNFGSRIEDRIAPDDRKALAEMESQVEQARQKAQQIKNDAIARQTEIERLTARKNTFVNRLAQLQRIDLPAMRTFNEKRLMDLLGTHEVETEVGRRIEKDAAIRALAEIPVLEKYLPGIVKQVKADLAQAEKDLAAVKEGK